MWSPADGHSPSYTGPHYLYVQVQHRQDNGFGSGGGYFGGSGLRRHRYVILRMWSRPEVVLWSERAPENFGIDKILPGVAALFPVNCETGSGKDWSGIVAGSEGSHLDVTVRAGGHRSWSDDGFDVVFVRRL